MEPEMLPDVKNISIKNAEHYTWGNHCDGWFLLKSENLHAILERMPAHSAEVMHYHRKSLQMFYVLRGELTMRTEKGTISLTAGHAAVIEPPTPHQARNDSEEDAEFLVISSPPSHGDRFNCE
jgi:quercetin dioxygenase-like cupin family protein